jgi:predicted histone-like DNA-binding protein
MAVPFVSRKRLNPRDLKAAGKFYPAPAYIAEIDVNQLSAEISDNTTLTPTEVIGVIKSLLQTVPKYLMLGYKVRLDSFGIFKLGFKKKASCKGWDKATEVTANDIDGLKINFTPDVLLDQKLSKPEYVKLDSKYLSDDEDENPDKGE